MMTQEDFKRVMDSLKYQIEEKTKLFIMFKNKVDDKGFIKQKEEELKWLVMKMAKYYLEYYDIDPDE